MKPAMGQDVIYNAGDRLYAAKVVTPAATDTGTTMLCVFTDRGIFMKESLYSKDKERGTWFITDKVKEK